MRDSCVFYRSFFDAIKLLPKKHKLQFYEALFDYALNDEPPTSLSGSAAALFKALQPQIDANNRKYENGKKGGRPAKNQTETKPKPNDNQTETKVKPNENVNENQNSNVNKNKKENVSAGADVRAVPPSVLSYLNSRAGSSWRLDDAVGVRLIVDLIRKGYTEDDMREVVDRKCDEWLGDPKMERYLRPSTLFKPENFTKYLDAPDSARLQKQKEDELENKCFEEASRKFQERVEREMAEMQEQHEAFMREHGLRE